MAKPSGDAYSSITVDLSGQVAIVTGASRGLGRAIALAYGKAGAKVACVARDVDKLKEVVATITDAGGEAEAFACDVKSSESVEQVFEAVESKWGSVEIVVNNAGITRDTLMPRMSDEEFDEVILTNLRGCFLFARAASQRMMRARYGRIINMSSVAGLIGNKGQTNYSASKAGLIGMTRSLSKELAGRGVTVNAIAPGFIESDMTAALGAALDEFVKAMVPAKRPGKAEDVAVAALYLASPAANYVTGHTLVVDGGMTG